MLRRKDRLTSGVSRVGNVTHKTRQLRQLASRLDASGSEGAKAAFVEFASFCRVLQGPESTEIERIVHKYPGENTPESRVPVLAIGACKKSEVDICDHFFGEGSTRVISLTDSMLVYLRSKAPGRHASFIGPGMLGGLGFRRRYNWVFQRTLQLTENHEEWIDCAAEDSRDWCYISIQNKPYSSIREVCPDMVVDGFRKHYDGFVYVNYKRVASEWFPVEHDLWNLWKQTRLVNLLFCRKKEVEPILERLPES